MPAVRKLWPFLQPLSSNCLPVGVVSFLVLGLDCYEEPQPVLNASCNVSLCQARCSSSCLE